jgi:peroxiredoxin
MLGAESTKWGGNLPATFVFDAQGRLVKFWDVQVTQADLEEAVAAAR